jgi:phosphocarrier protein HPr
MTIPRCRRVACSGCCRSSTGAKFVQTVERYHATVAVTRAGETVGGRSIMGLLTLGAAMGTRIAVTAVGEDAEACLDAIEALLANRFGEDE